MRLNHKHANYLRIVISFSIVIFGWLTITGSGDSSDSSKNPASYQKVSSSSFSPIRATNAAGENETLYWKYRINDGKEVTAEQDNLTMRFSFSTIDMTIDPKSLKRKADFKGDISGEVEGLSLNGDVEASVDETLSSLETSTFVDTQNLKIDMVLTVMGEKMEMNIDMSTDFEEPVEWFLDRNDLDTLPIGYVYDEQGDITGMATGTFELEIPGLDTIKESVNDPVVSVESWEIIGKLDTYTVNGTEYNNIVKVKRKTKIPESGLSGVSFTDADIIYWVAKGIGMIKGEGQFSILGQPLSVELVETNLSVSVEEFENETGDTE